MELASTLLVALLGLALFQVLWVTYVSPLRSIPGPLLAKYTDFWRFWSFLGRRPEVTQRQIHDELGTIVRLGPNMVSISDPDMIPIIYSRQKVLIKGDFYRCHDLNVDGKRVENIFSTRDEEKNSSYIKPVSNLYSMSKVLDVEAKVNNTVVSFLKAIKGRFAAQEGRPAKPCNIHDWCHYFAWDVIAELTLGKPKGFIEAGSDVEDILKNEYRLMDYLSLTGQMPWLDDLLERNGYVKLAPGGLEPLVQFVGGIITERLKLRESGGEASTSKQPDMLDGIMDARPNDPMDVQMEAVFALTAAAVTAGSDTVAGSLQAMVYHLSKNPSVLKKLQAELETVDDLDGVISWAQCQNLPYLRACISEGMRIYPPFAAPLERRVGEGGLALPNGVVLPAGTLVGMNPYVLGRDRRVYGEDVNSFRPERWLKHDKESDEDFKTRIALMNRTDMSFGAGKRICIGRNIALLEMHKFIASTFKAFDFELVHSDRDWTTHNAIMMRHTDMDVLVKLRK